MSFVAYFVFLLSLLAGAFGVSIAMQERGLPLHPTAVAASAPAKAEPAKAKSATRTAAAHPRGARASRHAERGPSEVTSARETRSAKIATRGAAHRRSHMLARRQHEEQRAPREIAGMARVPVPGPAALGPALAQRQWPSPGIN